MHGDTTARDGAPATCALAMTWLDSHLPLTLIMDLSMPHGPHSRELLAAEPATDPATDPATEPALGTGSGAPSDTRPGAVTNTDFTPHRPG